MSDPPFNTITLEPTLRCNLHCAMCYQHALRKTPEISMPQWIKILDFLDTQSLWLIGGEVFIRNDLCELVDYACTRGWDVGLTTNGLLVDEKYMRKISRFPAIKKIVFSLDGPMVIHNMLRGSQEAYEQVTRAIRLTRDYAYITVNVVLNPITSEHLLDLVNEASKLGVSKINVVLEESYSHNEIEQTKLLLSSQLQWSPETYELAVSNRINSIQAWQSEGDWTSIIENATERGVQLGVMVECDSVFNQPAYAGHYKLGSLRDHFRLDCANRDRNSLRLNPKGHVLGCGSIRKLLVEEINSVGQARIAVEQFFESLSRLNFLPICTRCCKIRVR